MCAIMLGALLNVILDPIFIYTLDLGIAGAAIATAISQIVSTVVYLCYILQKKSVLNFRIKECCFSKEIMSEILKIGIPTLVFQLLTSLSISMINNAAKDYGSSALATRGPLTKIMSMGSLVVFGFLKGFQPIADVLAAVITVFMATRLHKELTVAKTNISPNPESGRA